MGVLTVYEGPSFSLLVGDAVLGGGKTPRKVAELRIDLKGESVNKFNQKTIQDLDAALAKLEQEKGIEGLLLTSGKDVFVVGADILEFTELFTQDEKSIATWLLKTNTVFSRIEDLPYPSVAVLNGFALGGGFEFPLCATYRVSTPKAKLGLPETKLGIIPGWGGTVRLSRLCGADNAIEWIAGGEQNSAEAAFKIGAVDAVVAPENLRSAAEITLEQAISGKLPWRQRQQQKKAPLTLNAIESTMAFDGSKAFVAGKAGPHYPAPVAAIDAIQKGAQKSRDEALPFEAAAFARVAKTDAARSLVGIFLNDQVLKKTAKKQAASARPVKVASVLGAGIMGGGIAYQSASRGVPIVMKDIAQKSLELGLAEAGKLLEKQVSRGKMTTAQMAEVLGRIRATLSYGDFESVDIVVEAVVENEGVKKKVLQEVEGLVKPGTILASNTSTISISRLATALKRPEDFCGMHFFNPVPRMPLVEVIRGKQTGEAAIATTVAYAVTMGKTPIVVNDCAGFFVNRVLFPYFAGFTKLVADGVNFLRIDKVMEKWGWPMGPAYLLDVVGLDTGQHADSVMAAEFPDRMKNSGPTALSAMYEQKRFGQKNGVGFYRYQADKRGAPKKEVDPEAFGVLKKIVASSAVDADNKSVSDEQIIERMMIPMLMETVRCLDEKVIGSAAEADMGLIYGLGFPPFRGGIIQWARATGGTQWLERAEKYSKTLGKLYEPQAALSRFL